MWSVGHIGGQALPRQPPRLPPDDLVGDAGDEDGDGCPDGPNDEPQTTKVSEPDGKRNTGALIPGHAIPHVALWDRWPREALLAKFDILGQRAAAQGFGLVPRGPEDVLFKTAWIDEALDSTFSLPSHIDQESPFFKMRRFAGCDLAISK